MAKAKEVEREQQNPKALAVPTAPQSDQLPAEMDDIDNLLYEHAGMGVSLRASDNITPSIVVLQPLSPQVLAGPQQLPRAAAGDFWIRGADDPIIKGQAGFYFQPVTMTEWWFEFVPREKGGGFVARYPVEYGNDGNMKAPNGARQDRDNPYRYTFANGNNCTHYRFIPGILWENRIGLEYVIQFHGTGHTIARQWNTKWTRKRFPNGKIMPTFSHIYHLSTVQRSNPKGTWFIITVDEGVPIRKVENIIGDIRPAIMRGLALAQAFATGEKVEATPDQDVDIEQGHTTTLKEDAKDEIPF